MSDRSGSGGGETGARRTLGGSTRVTGTGLHSGKGTAATLGPGEPGAGIRFVREDLEGEPSVRARLEEIVEGERATSLGAGDDRVDTVEHLLAALAALGVDDAEVRLEGSEPPALDGSAAPWCRELRDVGIVEHGGEANPPLRIEETFTVEEDGSRYTVSPYPDFRISAEIRFEHPLVGRQFASFEVSPETFCDELAPARTFGLESWQEELRARGLARGASPENTLVLTDRGLAGDVELRFPDEFVRHKLLDLVGDLALLGRGVEGHVTAYRPSHRGNVTLAREIARRAGRGGGKAPALDIQEILDHIPHRYPFLLVDRVLEHEPGERILGIKNVTINEPFFRGHFPGHPIMPGVLVVEAMAQVGGLLLMHEVERPEDKVVYFMSLDDVKFRRPVTPGDQIRFEVEMVQHRGAVCRMRGTGTVDGDRVAEATMTARIMDR